MTSLDAPAVRAAHGSVLASFALNGLLFATWFSRVPDVRELLDLSNSRLGLLLLCTAAGSVIALPLSGPVIQRLGTAPVMRLASVIACGGIGWAAAWLTSGSFALVGAGLFTYGLGIGVWDVAMNVEGATVERQLGRTVMPRYHAAFSLGAVLGAGIGAAVVAWGPSPLWHVGVIALLCLASNVGLSYTFLPDAPADEGHSSAWAAWREPRTLLIGAMVLALAMTEGTANDWLAVAIADGYGTQHWVAVAGFGLFVAAMTLGRFTGGALLDRFGRVAVLWATIGSALLGLLLLVFGGSLLIAAIGIVLWGLGASLGFPVGMSAAADDPARAAARVSVVSTVGYAAFLAGPPLLGFVGDRVGTLRALLVVAGVLIPAMLLVPATRPPATGEAGAP